MLAILFVICSSFFFCHFTWLNANSLATSLAILLTVWLATLLGIFFFFANAIAIQLALLLAIFADRFLISFTSSLAISLSF